MEIRIPWLWGLATATVLALAASPAAAQNAVSTPPAPTFAVGDAVEVSYSGTWYPATVLTVLGGRWEIAYDGYGDEWHQLVGPDRIRARPAPVATPPASTSPTSPASTATTPAAPPPGRAITHLVRLGSGTNVLVEWHGTWYRARIIRAIDDTNARIHYVGYDRSSDEDVAIDRVRFRDKT